MIEDESDEGSDVVPGAEADVADTDGASPTSTRRRLRDLANEAEALIGSDPKLTRGMALVRDLLKHGRNPIVFCRYIATAEYVAAALQEDLSRAPNKRELGGVTVWAVTGQLPSDERKARVEELADKPRRVLVATTVSLRASTSSVVSTPWSTTTSHGTRLVMSSVKDASTVTASRRRPSSSPPSMAATTRSTVSSSTFSSAGMSVSAPALGFSVPVPVDSNAVLEAILEGILLKRPKGDGAEQQLVFFEDLVKPKKDDLHKEWERAAEAEKQSRSRFAQKTIDVAEVAEELRSARTAVGQLRT